MPLYQRDGLFTSGDVSSWLLAEQLKLCLALPGFRPSFGELLVLRGLEVRLYGEAVWRPQLGLGSGLEISLDASLLGLVSSRLLGSLGWDFSTESLVWRFFLKTLPIGS